MSWANGARPEHAEGKHHLFFLTGSPEFTAHQSHRTMVGQLLPCVSPTSIHDLVACFGTRRTGQKFLDWRGVCLAQPESPWRTVRVHGLVSMFCLRKSTTRSAESERTPLLDTLCTPGTAGFRAKAHLLPSTFLRMGFLAALRSQQTGQVCVLHPSLTQRRVCTTGCCQLVGTS